MPKKKVLIFFLATFLFFLFIFFSYLVAKEKFTNLDFDTTIRLQDHISRRWDFPFSVFSILGLPEVTSFFWLIMVIFLLVRKLFLAAFASLLFWIGLAIEVFGKVFVFHPAPPFFLYRGVIKFGFTDYYIHTDYSYPSGHVYRTAFLVSFLLIWAFLKVRGLQRYLIYTFLLIYWITMAISRVYLGEHWFTDVIGGGMLGGAFGLLTGVFISTKTKKSKLLTEQSN